MEGGRVPLEGDATRMGSRDLWRVMWWCDPCSFSNYAYRQECRRCGAPKMLSEGPEQEQPQEQESAKPQPEKPQEPRRGGAMLEV